MMSHWRNSSNVLPFRAPFKRGEVSHALVDSLFVLIGIAVVGCIPVALALLWFGLF